MVGTARAVLGDIPGRGCPLPALGRDGLRDPLPDRAQRPEPDPQLRPGPPGARRGTPRRGLLDGCRHRAAVLHPRSPVWSANGLPGAGRPRDLPRAERAPRLSLQRRVPRAMGADAAVLPGLAQRRSGAVSEDVIASSTPLVVVSAGTYHLPFDRLMEWMQRWRDANPEVRLLVQHGPSQPVEGADNIALLPYDELLAQCADADAVV